MKLTGNTIVITGGSSGIGLGMALRFLKDGNKVIICGRRQDRLEAIAHANPSIETRVCDITNHKQRADFAAMVMANHPDVNVLVNNAGIQYATAIGSGIDMTRVHGEIETNLVAVIHFCDLFVNQLSVNANAAIINVSSGLGFVPLAATPVYCATKAAVHSFSLSLRHQLQAKAVEVIELIPPSVDTELGNERHADASHSHGGMPTAQFISETFQGLERQELEIAVGQAAALREKGQELFASLNTR